MIGKTSDEKKEILSFYKDNNSKVHIMCWDGFFYNGEVLEIKDIIVILNDIKNGETAISISNIKKIDNFREVE